MARGTSGRRACLPLWLMPARWICCRAMLCRRVVITPHAGELAALLNRLDADMADVVSRQWVEARPLRAALRAHELTGATVLLKGAVTIVVGADGDGNTRIILSGRAPAWMATAGSGDVLAGVLGALLAQQDDMLSDDPALVPEVAAAAAYMHGLAGAMASGSEQRGWHLSASVWAMRAELRRARSGIRLLPVMSSRLFPGFWRAAPLTVSWRVIPLISMLRACPPFRAGGIRSSRARLVPRPRRWPGPPMRSS